MAQTNAERQAAFKEKKQAAIDELTTTNASLLAENIKLQAEVKALTEKLHKAELSALRVQLKARPSTTPPPKKSS